MIIRLSQKKKYDPMKRKSLEGTKGSQKGKPKSAEEKRNERNA